MDSATATASLIAASGLAEFPENTAARSRRSRGNCHSRATALAESDFPQP